MEAFPSHSVPVRTGDASSVRPQRSAEASGGDTPFGCSVCSQRFGSKSAFRRHTAALAGRKPFSCSVCDKSFRERSNLQRHLRAHAAESGCSVCDQVFREPRDLHQHLSHTHRTCPVCRAAFQDLADLKQHLRAHAEEGALDPALLQERPFSCSDCGKRFRLNADLTKHAVAHTGRWPHRCSVCDQSFYWKHLLHQHLSHAHRTCPVCQAAFQEQAELTEHLTSHCDSGLTATSLTPAAAQRRPSGAAAASETCSRSQPAFQLISLRETLQTKLSAPETREEHRPHEAPPPPAEEHRPHEAPPAEEHRPHEAPPPPAEEHRLHSLLLSFALKKKLISFQTKV